MLSSGGTARWPGSSHSIQRLGRLSSYLVQWPDLSIEIAAVEQAGQQTLSALCMLRVDEFFFKHRATKVWLPGQLPPPRLAAPPPADRRQTRDVIANENVGA